MKKIYSLVLVAILGTSMASFAQTYDVSCDTILLPNAGGTWAQGVLPVVYTRTNQGDTLAAADTVKMTILVDGTVSRVVNRGASVFPTGKVDTGQTTITVPTISIGNHDVCVVASIATQTDNDPSNDTACVSITIDANDLAVDSMEVSSPAKMENDTFLLGESINTLFVRLQNASSAPYILTTLPLTVDVAGTSRNLSLSLNNAVPAGARINASVPDSLVPALPTSVGPFQVCVYTTLSIDGDNSNDTICKNYVMAEDPTIGLDNIVKVASQKAYVHNDVLNVEFNNYSTQTVELTIVDLTGKNILTESIELSGSDSEAFSISVAELSRGIYILNDGVNTQKFVKH